MKNHLLMGLDVVTFLGPVHVQAYEQTWDLTFRYHKAETAFNFRELAVTAGEWRIAHEHHSIPVTDQRC